MLGAEDGKLFCDYFDASNDGNFEHKRSILHVRSVTTEFAQRYSISEAELESRLAAMKSKLLEQRALRVRPNKDDKILTDWNGLMISALARGYQTTGEEKYRIVARKCAAFIQQNLFTSNGLMRVYRAGTVKQHGFITDYAFLLNGLVDLYESDFDVKWLEWADQLALDMLAKFEDKDNGGFFMTIPNQTDLLVRQKDSYDGAIPSGSSVATMALLRLSLLLDNKSYRIAAERTLQSLAANANKVPMAYMNLLNAADLLIHQPQEIAIVGTPGDESTLALIQCAYQTYTPGRVIAFSDPANPTSSSIAARIPLTKDRRMINGTATAYVCPSFACRMPTNDVKVLAAQLGQ